MKAARRWDSPRRRALEAGGVTTAMHFGPYGRARPNVFYLLKAEGGPAG
jgi:hypothetical protein